jgi:hypothetical protein
MRVDQSSGVGAQDCPQLVEPERLGGQDVGGYETAPTSDRGDLGASGERITVAATVLPSIDRFPDGHCLWSGVRARAALIVVKGLATVAWVNQSRF